MATTYVYSISTNFGGQFNPSQFQELITNDPNIVTPVREIDTDGDSVSIIFLAALSPGELTSLGSLIASYVYGADPRVDLISTGTYGSIASLTIGQTSNRTITLPDITDTLIGQDNSVTIRNKTLTSANNNISTGWDAIVDSNGKGNFTSISAAFAAGRSSVLVSTGTYYETSDINIPNGGKIMGEANGLVVVIFIGSVGLKADANNGVNQTAGTISMIKNSNNVIGTGTNFTSLFPGQYILIGNNFYMIASIIDDNNLVIVDTYRGATFSGKNYIAQTMYTGITIENLLLVGSTSVAMYLRGLRHFTVRSTAVINSNPNIQIVDSGDSSLYTMIVTNGIGHGVELINCYDFLCDTINTFNCSGDAIKISGPSRCLIMESCSCSCNGGNGIHISDTSECVGLTDCVCKQNAGSGILVGANTTYTTAKGCIVLDNSNYGIQFSGNKHIVSNCIVKENGNNGINCGNEGIIKGNQCVYNNGHGIDLTTDNYCTVEGNRCTNNTKFGIYCMGINNIIANNVVRQNTGGIQIVITANNTLVATNQILSNGESNYIDAGVNTISTNNIIL